MIRTLRHLVARVLHRAKPTHRERKLRERADRVVVEAHRRAALHRGDALRANYRHAGRRLSR